MRKWLFLEKRREREKDTGAATFCREAKTNRTDNCE
jgi:hypothetical protein